MGYRTCKWNKEEETQLMEYVNDEVSWEDISRELQRSIPACKKRIKLLDERLLAGIAEVANSVEVQEEIDAILNDVPLVTASPKWTDELDFYLLTDFYELSIDEARERFDASYSEIAGRLEELYEGKDEYSIEMLLRASKFIKQRKGLPTSDSTSKKEAKILKKIQKLRQKLKQVRDE